MTIKYLKKSPKTSSTDDTKTREIVENILKDIEKTKEEGCIELSKKFDKYEGEVVVTREKIEQIKKQTKDPEAVVRLTDKGAKKYSKGAISTGSISLDSAIGIGGVPRGKIIEVYGPEASGKTTLALHIIAQAQKNDGYAAFIDAEHALDPNYAEAYASLAAMQHTLSWLGGRCASSLLSLIHISEPTRPY